MIIKLTERKLEDIDGVISEIMEEENISAMEELRDNIFYSKNLELMKLLPEIVLDGPIKENFKDIDINSEDIEIEVIFIPESLKEYVSGSFNVSDALGLAAFTQGDLLFGEKFYNDKFQVVVFCPTNQDLKEKLDYLLEIEKEDYLHLLLNTLPHEISHITLFLESSGGQTPEEVDINFDSGLFKYNVDDCILGEDHPKYKKLFSGQYDKNQVMENLVEKKGLNLLEKLNLIDNSFVRDFENKINNPGVKKRKIKM